jgi:hypothetical protein
VNPDNFKKYNNFKYKIIKSMNKKMDAQTKIKMDKEIIKQLQCKGA